MPLKGSALANPAGMLLEFENFLNSPEYLAYCTYEHEEMTRKGERFLDVCVLDIIEQWALEGNLLDLCPTYDTLLLVALTIANEAEIGSIGNSPLWHRDAPGVHREFAFVGQIEVHQHPVLNRHRFEMEQARRTADRNKRLDALLAANSL